MIFVYVFLFFKNNFFELSFKHVKAFRFHLYTELFNELSEVTVVPLGLKFPV